MCEKYLTVPLHHIRMRNLSHQPGFALERLDKFLVREVLLVEDLEGDDTVEAGVVGAVNGAKTAVTNFFDYVKFPQIHLLVLVLKPTILPS